MGYYIETDGFRNKAEFIAKNYGGTIIPKPNSFSEIPKSKALICVVDNLSLGFEAAGYCFDASEFEAFTNPNDLRPKKWVVMDLDKAEELSNFKRRK